MPAPENRFKSALMRGERLIGCWAGFADPYATEVLASAGFDWLVIDGEHAPNDLRSISAQLAMLAGRQSLPVVRLPMGEAWAIKQVLDAGAQSLIIPMVESADQARALVRATRYPPEGIRGSGAALARASDFSRITDYIPTANAQICLIVQVESMAGIDALGEILAVDMGYVGDSHAPEVQEVIRGALARIAASPKAAGILALDPDTAQRYADWGAQFLAVGIDVVMLAQAARATVARWRDA